jgi:NAD(P)-dependent dehydrogenase (short-subunit alcohol dehydrogenase family)
MYELFGQIAIVTGGASGIGREIATVLAAAGASVIIADRNQSGAAAVSEELSQTGATVRGFQLDVAEPDQVEELLDHIVSSFGGLHILVHSAGIGVERPFLETSNEEWRRILDVDLCGAFYCMRAAGRIMSERQYGRIIMLASTAGVRGGTGRAAYGAAKSGVINLTKVLAVELGQKNVTVNALAPGAIETELVARMHSSDTRRNYRRAIPMDRYGTPQEVANAALFLASPKASYVTGHVLAVDGGFLAAGVINKID